MAGLQVSLVGRGLLLPDDAAQSSLIDIRPAKGQKVLSVRWMPSQPWLPPQVVSFRPGEWLIAFDQEAERAWRRARRAGRLCTQLAPYRSKAAFDIVHQDKNLPLQITRTSVEFDDAASDPLSA